MENPPTQNSTVIIPLIEPPTYTISETTKQNRHCCKVHLAFLALSGILGFAIMLDLTDSLPTYLTVRIDSFSVSSFGLNISNSPNYPSSITATWNVTLSIINENWKLTQLVDKVEITVLYHGAPLVVAAAAVPFQIRAQQRASSPIDVTATQRVENWVAKNILADQIRDDAVTLDMTMKAGWSAKGHYSKPFICKRLKVSFNATSGYDHGLVLNGPNYCLIWSFATDY